MTLRVGRERGDDVGGAGDGLDPTAGDPGGASARPDPALAASPPGYVIERELGRGGMGVVYLARQTGLNRRVAVKMILAGEHSAPDDLARFFAEAEAIAQLEHPNIVGIYEVGEHRGRPFFTLEYCEGGSLDRELGGRRLAPGAAARLAETLARAVDAAHQQGIVHRDLKPQNILLTAGGTPKVTDFGVAKRVGAGMGLTVTGELMGSPSYMAPEQVTGGKEVTPAADVYSLGAILYETLTGRPPFRAATPLDTILRLLSGDLVPPRHLRPDLPRDLEAVCLKCLERDPRRRYPTAGSAAADLGRFLRGEPVEARPMGFRKRLSWWCHHPDRVGDAGTFSIFLMLAITAWAVCGLVVHLVAPATADGRESPHPDEFAIPHFVGLVEGLFLPLFFTGLGAIRGKIGALWAGLGLSAVGLAVLLLGLGGAGPLVGSADGDRVWGGPPRRFFALGFPVVLCGIAAGAYAVALFAHYRGWSTGSPTPWPDPAGPGV